MTGDRPQPTPPAIRATPREWIGLGVIALPCMIYAMDLTVLNLAVPTLAAELRPSAGALLWIIDIYGFMVAGFLMTMGTLGDRIGRRKLLLIGAACFGAVSTLAAFSNSATMLIIMRAVLGIAGATIAPSTLSLIAVMFRDEKQRTFAISMWIASFSLGGLLGPVIGGVLIQYFWWGSVFLIAVPVMLLLLVIGPALLPEYKDPGAGRLDLTSALMSLMAVLGIIYGVKRGAEFGFDAASLLSIVAGLALIALFLRRQAQLADPMIDLMLFRSRAFCAAMAINLASLTFMFGCFVFLAQYLQLVAGLTPLDAGLWNLPGALGFLLTSFATPALAARIKPSLLIALGMSLAAVGFGWLALTDDFLQIIAASVVFSVGFTPVIALTTGLIVGSAPPERAGAASALSETSLELGGALGIALLGSLGAAIYRSRMAGAGLDGVAADTLSAAQATLGGAVAAVAGLSGEKAHAFLETARAAFMLGFHAAAAVSIPGMLLCVVLALVYLRQEKPAGH